MGGIVGCVLVGAVPCWADIYVYTDASGVRHFTDRCTQPRCQLFLKNGARTQLQVLSTNKRGRSRVNATQPSYYTYYSKALMGYPQLRAANGAGRNASPYTQQALAEYPATRAYSYRSAPVTTLTSLGSRTSRQQNRQFYAPQIELVARIYGLDPKLMHAVISAESAYNPQAVSNKGAQGLMQLMPDTARRFGVPDAFDPVANMHGGARYLRWLMDRFQNDLSLVLAAYNAGEGAVERYGNVIPPYQETRTYVSRVLGFYNSYRGLNRVYD